MQQWELRVFAFVLGICEENAFLAIKYALGNDDMPTLLNFCRKLGWQLILNPDLAEGQVEHYQIGLEGRHTLCCAPRHAHIYCNCHWICDAQQVYQQYKCCSISCNNHIRTYCACRPSAWMCGNCHVGHVIKEQQCGN